MASEIEEWAWQVIEATEQGLHFEDSAVHPRLVQLHYVKDELIPAKPHEAAAPRIRRPLIRILERHGYGVVRQKVAQMRSITIESLVELL